MKTSGAFSLVKLPAQMLAVTLFMGAWISPVSANTNGSVTTSSTVTNYDSWVLACQSLKEKDKDVKNCEVRATVLVQDKDSGQQGIAAVIAIGGAAKEKNSWRMAASVPSSAALDKPMKFSIKDNQPMLTLTYKACQPQACTADVPVTDADIRKLKRPGEQIVLQYVNQLGQTVSVEAPSKGLAAALQALDQQ